MAKHIGIVACSAEGAALCYRTICAEAPQEMGKHRHPEITLHTHPLSEYMAHIRSGKWDGVAQLMLSSAHKVAQAGADFAICPDNTIHQAFDLVTSKSPIPWLHIAETVGDEARKMGTSGIPEKEDREHIDRIIFEELVNGVFSEKSRIYFNEVIGKLKDSGCDAVVLGCTEIPLIVDPNDCPLPTLDSTRLLARAAIREALGKT